LPLQSSALILVQDIAEFLPRNEHWNHYVASDTSKLVGEFWLPVTEICWIGQSDHRPWWMRQRSLKKFA